MMKVIATDEQMKLTGVYCIRNAVNGKRYVGSAGRSFKQRIAGHRGDLNNNRHRSSLLQNAWNKYGDGAFEFTILRVTSPEEAVIFEQAYIDLHKAADRKCGYNICEVAGSTLGRKHSDKSRAAMSERCKKVNGTPEARAANSERQKKIQGTPEARARNSACHKGKRLSAEHRAKLSVAGKGKPKSLEHRERISAANKGKTQSAEHRAKLGLLRKGRTYSEETLARMRAAGRRRIGSRASEATCAKIGAAHKGKVISDDAKLKQSESTKALNADPVRKAIRLSKFNSTRLRNKLAKASRLLQVL